MTQPDPIRSILVVGGGAAGWMTAAALGTLLKSVRVELVESDEIGIIGVGEATIPPIRVFNRMLGIDEAAFVRATQASYKLGIDFVGWTRPEERYFHPFGGYGVPIDNTDFHHFWLKAQAEGWAHPLADYSICTIAAAAGRFAATGKQPASSPLAQLQYAYHFDAAGYAAFLRQLAESRGVRRHEGRVADVGRDGGSGFVTHVQLEDGRRLQADLFIDCSGFRALLLGQALGVGYTDWSRWLPCDRALAMPARNTGPLLPYTRSTARAAGWTWRIPLQHRTGNGYVYSSAHVDDAQAERTLRAALEGEPLGDPRLIRFTTGHRDRLWEKNVVAIGLASGFLEPLESTSIHLVQSSISRLVNHFPSRRCEPSLVERYNRIGLEELEHLRDFLVLHYLCNQRDEPFWRERRTLGPTPTLAGRMALFEESGFLHSVGDQLFQDSSWLAVMLGQGVRPRGWSPLVAETDPTKVRDILAMLRTRIGEAAAGLPLHADFLAQAMHAT